MECEQHNYVKVQAHCAAGLLFRAKPEHSVQQEKKNQKKETCKQLLEEIPVFNQAVLKGPVGAKSANQKSEDGKMAASD